MSADEFNYEHAETSAEEVIEEDIPTNDDDELSFSEQLENYLPTYENTDKVKKPFPVWFTSLITAFVTCFIILMAYTFIILPHIRPSAVISYTQSEAKKDGEETLTDIGAIAQKATQSIVKVSGQSDYRSFFGFSTQTSSGSGIIISENGYILTANSLVGSNGEATVTIGKDSYTANIVGQDIAKDIAIIKIDLQGLTPAQLGDSDSVKTGDTAIAIANILGGDIGISVTRGIICGINKDVSLSNGNSVNLLQTDATTVAANGGCLLDTSGNVIGMITSSITANTDKIVFAIPSNDILTVAESIINTGLAPSGLTIGIKGLDADHGVTVDAVVDDSPAKKAGIEKGDLILKVDGTVVKSVSEINKIRDTHKKGDTIILTIYRNGEILDIKVVL
ncbi:MAG: S1C family serine protease [Firmicutes bacterium]|nr:S1C family serine protease [Bacillota bacterium]